MFNVNNKLVGSMAATAFIASSASAAEVRISGGNVYNSGADVTIGQTEYLPGHNNRGATAGYQPVAPSPKANEPSTICKINLSQRKGDLAKGFHKISLSQINY